jgi:hypothetical protein
MLHSKSTGQQLLTKGQNTLFGQAQISLRKTLEVPKQQNLADIGEDQHQQY